MNKKVLKTSTCSREKKKVKTVIIDHDDSFTHILAQYVNEISGKTPVILNHLETSVEEIKNLNPTHIILSPGPGNPKRKKDFSIGNKILKEFETKTPILGICLGHQGIAAHYGAKIIKAYKVMHGKKSEIKHSGKDIFKKVKSPTLVMRYHSLTIKNLPENLTITAETKHKNEMKSEIMAFKHKKLPIYGLQFHPESVGTKEGKKILKNFLEIS